METNETFVTEQVAENVEQTTEETVVEPAKVFTQEDLNAAVGKAKARERAKITKQFERKYGQLESVLKTGTGKESVEEITDTFKEFYQKKGFQFDAKPDYSDEDIEILAKAEAEDIIRSGYEDVVDEVERLTEIGFADMTAREKAVFKVLADHRQSAERGRELTQIGVTADVYESKEFKDFASKFNATTPIRDIYDIYSKTKPRKEIKPMGSMKHNGTADNGIKDFYSFEEASKFTKADFDKNPELYKKVTESMPKWYKK